jgi:CrcB protein
MVRLTLIFLGGGCGTLLRYLIAGWMQRGFGSSFPVGTFTVNVVGCVIIGFAATLFTGPVLLRDDYRFALLVGVLGGFTTFSSYSWETISLANDGQWAVALANVLFSNGCGLTAAWLGARTAVALYGS